MASKGEPGGAGRGEPADAGMWHLGSISRSRHRGWPGTKPRGAGEAPSAGESRRYGRGDHQTAQMATDGPCRPAEAGPARQHWTSQRPPAAEIGPPAERGAVWLVQAALGGLCLARSTASASV